jgi:hypothetical protein
MWGRSHIARPAARVLELFSVKWTTMVLHSLHFNGGTREPDGSPYFVAAEFKNKVVLAVQQYLSVLESFDARLPLYAFRSLCDVAQCLYRYSPDGPGWFDTGPLNREILALPEIVIDNLDTDVPALIGRFGPYTQKKRLRAAEQDPSHLSQIKPDAWSRPIRNG